LVPGFDCDINSIHVETLAEAAIQAIIDPNTSGIFSVNGIKQLANEANRIL